MCLHDIFVLRRRAAEESLVQIIYTRRLKFKEYINPDIGNQIIFSAHEAFLFNGLCFKLLSVFYESIVHACITLSMEKRDNKTVM